MTFQLTINHLLWRMQNVHPAAEVIGVEGSGSSQIVDRVSFSEVAVRVRALAAGLAESYDVTPGSTVAIMAFNTRAHVELLFAVPSIGAQLECLNMRMEPKVLLDQLTASAPKVLIIDQEAVDHPVVGPTVRAVIESAPAMSRILLIDASGGEEYAAIMASGRPAFAAPDLSEEQPAFLFHTSGTTGRPKTYRVRHRDAVLHALSQAAAGASCLTQHDRVLPLAPFFHVNGWGLPFTSAITGSDLVLIGADVAPGRVIDAMRELDVTVAAAVPTIWHDVCRIASAEPGRRPTKLREVLSGGSAVPLSVVQDVRDHLGAGVATAWGMTETMACSTFERAEPATSAGVPIPLVEMRIMGPTGPADAGEQGSLEVRGAFIVGAGDSPEGWMNTGDIASLGADGRLRLHDRERDLIKSGGEWIVSAEIEQHLCTMPGVEAAAVVAKPDPRWVERPVAFVVLAPGSAESVTEEEIRAHLLDRLPRWWMPDLIFIQEDLPKTAVGKIDKVALRLTQTQKQHQHSEEVA